MRIISGSCKGRIISPPKTFRARPTTDFAKESLFNIIANWYDFEDLDVLDLFSGTGSISYEFASRGARSVISVEMDAIHQSFIRTNANKLNLKQIRSLKLSAFAFLNTVKEQYDIIFADPPYDLDGIDALPTIITERKLVREGGVFIFEHSKNRDYSELPHFSEKRSYGSVNFSIFTY